MDGKLYLLFKSNLHIDLISVWPKLPMVASKPRRPRIKRATRRGAVHGRRSQRELQALLLKSRRNWVHPVL